MSLFTLHQTSEKFTPIIKKFHLDDLWVFIQLFEKYFSLSILVTYGTIYGCNILKIQDNKDKIADVWYPMHKAPVSQVSGMIMLKIDQKVIPIVIYNTKDNMDIYSYTIPN